MTKNKEKILIVDDDPIYLSYLTRLLEKNLDAEIIGEQNPTKALDRILNGEDFSVILLDVLMPIIDGFETSAKLRKAKIDIPILLLTGMDTKEITQEKIQSANPTDIFSKSSDPFFNILLINKIKLFIENHKTCRNRRLQSESRYKHIFEHAPVALFEEDISLVKEMIDSLSSEIGIDNLKQYLDQHPNFVTRAIKNIKVKQVNKKAYEIFKANTFEQLRASIIDTFTEESLEVFKQELVAMAKGLPEFESDVQYKTLEGESLETHFYIKLPEEQEDYKFVVATITDLSSIRSLERKSHELYSAISRSPAVVVKWSLDLSWPVEFISDNVFLLTGYSSEDFVSGKVSWRSIIHPQDAETVEKTVLDNINQSPSKDFVLKYRIVSKSMEIKWIKVLSTPSVNLKGQIMHFQSITTDVTKEVIMQNKLIDNVAKWKSLIESTKTAYIILDDRGIIKETNQQMNDLIGEKESIVGLTLRSLISDEHIWKFDKEMSRLLKGETLDGLELCVSGNGLFKCNVSWISLNAGLIENGTTKIFCLIRDITRAKTDELRKYIDNQKRKDKIKQKIASIRKDINKIGMQKDGLENSPQIASN